MFVRRSFVAAGLIAALACVPLVGRGAPSADAPAELTIAYQPGLSYSSLIVMRERGSLEKQFPQTKITWLVLNSTAAVRDGFIADQIQIGAGSIPPFLTGWIAAWAGRFSPRSTRCRCGNAHALDTAMIIRRVCKR